MTFQFPGPATAALLLTLATAAPAAVAEDAPPGSDPVFIARLADGSTLTVRIARLDAKGNWVLHPQEGEPRTVAADDLVSLVRDGVSPPAAPERSSLLLPDGDRLRAEIGKAGDETLAIQSPCLGPLDIPLSGIRALVFDPPTEAEAIPPFLDTLRAEAGGTEVLYLTNGDRVEGVFLGLSNDAVSLERRGATLKLPRAGVRALVFDARLTTYPQPRGTFLEFALTDGSRISARPRGIESGAVVADSRFGKPLRLPLAEIARITTRSESIQYLSDRAEDGVKYGPYLGSPRPVRRGSAVDGLPLMLRGQPYDRGLGMQSRTLAAYRLDPSALRFQARIGLDDRAGPLGSVVFRVRLDRDTLYESPPLTEGDPPVDLDLKVAGGQILVLEADYGDRGDVRDFADWADARIIRRRGTTP